MNEAMEMGNTLKQWQFEPVNPEGNMCVSNILWL